MRSHPGPRSTMFHRATEPPFLRDDMVACILPPYAQSWLVFKNFENSGHPSNVKMLNRKIKSLLISTGRKNFTSQEYTKLYKL